MGAVWWLLTMEGIIDVKEMSESIMDHIILKNRNAFERLLSGIFHL